jgi:hypothetical protein
MVLNRQFTHRQWSASPHHENAPLLGGVASHAGEAMVLEDNFFIEKILPGAVLRTLSAEERRPTLTFPREIPIEGEPADVAEIVSAYWCLVGDEQYAQAFLEGRARRATRRWGKSRHRTFVASPDRGHGKGDTFRPGRLSGRDWTGDRKMDGGRWAET